MDNENEKPVVRSGVYQFGPGDLRIAQLGIGDRVMTPKQMTLKALDQLKGDDAERARWAFRGCSEEEMQLMHGGSGKTRRQILDEYEEHERAVRSAIDWVNRQPD